MAKYRIKVEALEPNSEVHEELLNGVVCDGYFLCASRSETKNTIAIDNMSTIDIAISIAKSTDLLEAAMIAHGMEEARLMRKNRESRNGAALLAKLFND